MNNTLEGVSEIEISYRPSIGNKPIVTCSSDAYLIIKEYFPDEMISMQETCVVLFLNNANRVLGVLRLSKGGMTSAIVDIRILLATALKILSTGIILSHNHPSGKLYPSEQDKRLTNQIADAAKLLDIKLLDHLILAPDNQYLSMSEKGHL